MCKNKIFLTEHTVESGPSSILHEDQAFQLGNGGAHGTTPGSCGFVVTNSCNTVLLNKETASELFSSVFYKFIIEIST